MAVVQTPTTWNSADKAASITLSGGDLTFGRSTTAGNNVVRDTAIISGKPYFEITLNNASTTAQVGSGIMPQLATNLPPGIGAGRGYGAYLLFASGLQLFDNAGNVIATLGTGAASCVVMFAYDQDAEKLWVGRDGTWYNSGNPAAGTNPTFTGVTGTLFAAGGFAADTGTTSGTGTANFGATNFTYPVPSGFITGLLDLTEVNMQGKKGWDAYLMASVFEKEATYAAGKTHTSSTSCSYKGFDFDPGFADTVTSDKDEVTGKEHGYDQEITAYGNNPTLKFARVRPNDLAGLAALVLGSVTANQDGALVAYRHRIIPVTDGTALPSIAIVHKIGAIQTEYKGCKGNTMKLSGEQGGFLSADFGLIASGTRATNAASFAAAITESWMKVDQLKFWLETGANIQIAATPTQGTEDISSATPDNLSIRGKSFEFTWDNKAEGQAGFGGASVMQDVVYGRRAATMKATIQFADATEIAYFTAQDACAIELDFKAAGLIAVGGAMYYGASIVIPRAKIKAYPQPKGGVNDTLTQDFDFEVFENGTNPAVIMDVYTAQAAYLAAPA